MISIEMSLRLRKLIQQHHIELPTSSIALAPPADHPMILEGLAATTDIDHQRMRLRATSQDLYKQLRALTVAVDLLAIMPSLQLDFDEILGVERGFVIAHLLTATIMPKDLYIPSAVSPPASVRHWGPTGYL